MLTENKNKKPKKKKIRNYSKQNEETDLKKEIDFYLHKKKMLFVMMMMIMMTL